MSYIKKLFRRRRGQQKHSSTVESIANSSPASSLALPEETVQTLPTIEETGQPLLTAEATLDVNDTLSVNKMSVASESGLDVPQDHGIWPPNTISFVDLLQLFKTIRRENEHVAAIRALIELTNMASELIQTFDEEAQELDWSAAYKAIREHTFFFKITLDKMTRKDGARDPGSPLITPIRNYLLRLINIIVLILLDHGLLSAAERSHPEIRIVLWNSASFGSRKERTFKLVSQLNHAMDNLRRFINIYMEEEEELEYNPCPAKVMTLQGIKHRSLGKMSAEYGEFIPVRRQYQTCLPGSREPVLAAIEEWAGEEQMESRTLCLVDQTGVGKTTIANHMAQKWTSEGKLAARFFFSGGKSGMRTPEDSFLWLIKEIRSNNPEVDLNGSQSPIQTDNFFSIQPLYERWRRLVAYYASKLKAGPHFFVIDGLDECAKDVRLALVRCLLHTFHNMESRLHIFRLFITTCPESDIFESFVGFSAVSLQTVMYRPGERVVDLADVTLYINDQLRHILESNVTAEQRHLLAKRSRGSFIFASTACNIIKKGYKNADLVRRILSAEDSSHGELYQEAIKFALSSNLNSLEAIQEVLSIILAADRPLSCREISELVWNVSFVPVQQIVQDLDSVLASGSEDSPVYFLHPTFRDFLLQKSQSKQYSINICVGHRLLATACLEHLISQLERGLVLVEKPNKSVPHGISKQCLEDDMRRCASEALCYATTQWMVHASYALDQSTVRELILRFFLTKLLHWIELSTLLGKTRDLIPSIVHLSDHLEKYKMLEEGLQIQTNAVDLVRWCSDVVRFVKKTKKLWENSTPQLYVGALAYWQHSGPIYSHYASEQSEERPTTLIRLEVEDGKISGVNFYHYSEEMIDIAFSPDRRYLASRVRGGTVRVWNVSSGAQEAEFGMPVIKPLVYLSTSSKLVATTWDRWIQRFSLNLNNPFTISLNARMADHEIRVSLESDLSLFHQNTAAQIQELPMIQESRVHWNMSDCYLEFGKPPIERYPSPYGEVSKCHIDGNLAVVSSLVTGEFVVFDFHHMQVSSQGLMQGYEVADVQGYEAEEVRGYEVGEGE